MRACMIFENLKLIPDRKNRESYEKKKQTYFCVGKIKYKMGMVTIWAKSYFRY